MLFRMIIFIMYSHLQDFPAKLSKHILFSFIMHYYIMQVIHLNIK